MLRFSTEELIANAGTGNFEYVIVCWHTSPAVDEYISELQERFSALRSDSQIEVTRLDHKTNPNVGYVPNLRAMMNEGFSYVFGKYEYGGLVNTDQCFYKSWLQNLVKHVAPDRMITSKLIERGPITRHFKADLGLTEYDKFDMGTFNNLCEKLIKPGVLLSEEDVGGYMNAESLPYLFPRAMWDAAGPWELTLANGVPDVNFFDRGHSAGFKYFMSADSLAYHVGGGERKNYRPKETESMRSE
jgi:hypothetical protein